MILVLVLIALAIVPVAAPGTTQQEMRQEGQQSAVRKAAKKKVKKSSSGKTYVVQSGDSWASIAAKHDMTADELAQLNDSTTTAVLSVGQKLKVK